MTTATPDPDNPANHPSAERRNFLLGVVNGALGRTGGSLTHPNLIIAAFVYEITKSTLLVGLISALWLAGLMWPQLYLSSRIEHRARKKPFYIFATIVRILLLAALAATVFASKAANHAWIIPIFFIIYFAYSTAQGVAVLPFLDIIGQTVRRTRLGGFFGYRSLLGGLLATAAGFLFAQPLLDKIPSPSSYGILIATGLLCSACGWSAFFFVREQEDPAVTKKRSFSEVFASAGKMLLRDMNYKLLLAMRILFRFNALALVFYVPYGVQRLGAARMSGIFVGCIALSRLASSIIWGKLSDRHGNRLCLVWSGIFFFLSPAAVLLAPHLPPLFQWRLPLSQASLDLPLSVYLVALALFGLALESNIIGINALLLEAAPPDRRPSYIAFLNTVCFPFTFLPLLAGILIGSHTARFDALFAVLIAGGLLYLLAALLLTEVRGNSNPPPPR